MKTVTFCNQIVSTRFAGDIDTLVTDIFFAIVFSAYTVFVWELGGGVLTGVIAIIAMIFIARVIYQTGEWIVDVIRATPARPATSDDRNL